ncbi:hypothetical protein Celaphus_00007336 [Cervus elaphus hippelaphus]|uniref:Speedy protein E4-like n=1 Tax=Cervus elaphus hippelaphus TaxID=46360 RepID=A0A212CYN7_CEREH|nr:hypothetical protein Celaphus_00007336 [Cervus elaphus hippelaphus]
MEVIVSEEIPGPSALWASSSSLPWRPGSKRKWSAAFGAEAEDKAQDSWVVKIGLKKQQVLLALPEHHVVFNRMLEDHAIKRFLAWDRNLKVSDKRIHFFIALYLASKMEEDNRAPKQIIFSFLYGRNHSQRPLFHKLLFQFICSMNWKMKVTQEESKLFTRDSGCGIEIVPSCPRGPPGPRGPEITGLRKALLHNLMR